MSVLRRISLALLICAGSLLVALTFSDISQAQGGGADWNPALLSLRGQDARGPRTARRVNRWTPSSARIHLDLRKCRNSRIGY
jgi:hypothetical protein